MGSLEEMEQWVFFVLLLLPFVGPPALYWILKWICTCYSKVNDRVDYSEYDPALLSQENESQLY